MSDTMTKEKKTPEIVKGTETGTVVDTTQGGEAEANSRYRKQLTAEKIVGKILQEWIPEKGAEPKWLFNIYCQVESFERGETSLGPFLRLGGEFIARNYLTGEEMDGPIAILPAIGEMIVRNQLKAVGFGQPNGPRAVVFAMDIGIEWNKPDEVEVDGKKVQIKKYTWAIRPIGARAKTSLRIVREQMEAARLKAPPATPELPLPDSAPEPQATKPKK